MELKSKGIKNQTCIVQYNIIFDRQKQLYKLITKESGEIKLEKAKLQETEINKIIDTLHNDNFKNILKLK